MQAHNAVENYYHYTLGFTRATARSHYMDQGLREARHLTALANCMLVDKLCKYVRTEAKTTIALQACQHLNMLVYYLRHQERTSRVTPNLTDVLIMDIEALDQHRTVEEDWAKTH